MAATKPGERLTDADADAMTRRLSLRGRLLNGLWYVLAGILAATLFPPLSLDWLAWVALIPLLLLAMRQTETATWRLGYLWGLAHFTASFAWLREIFILIPLGVALICAVFPACWLKLSVALYRNLQVDANHDLRPQAMHGLPKLLPGLSAGRQVVMVVGSALMWVQFEWIRSWIFSGFPWNFLGVSQWMHGSLLELTRFTGVYGISLLIVLVNVALWLAYEAWRRGEKQRLAVPIAAIGVAVLIPILTRGVYQMPEPSSVLRIAAVQGNIPQIRVFTEEQLDMAIDVYWEETRQIVAAEKPDLVVWPETAIPASITNSEYCWGLFQQLAEEVKTPMLVGTLMFRPGPRGGEFMDVYNSAVLFNAEGQVNNYYDKIHTVPFGEYVPLADRFPILDKLFGMGRSLTSGQHHTLFRYGDHIAIGMNICYEDVFPEITRGAVAQGANVLVTITNDAWYWETSGSRQHMLNSLFRPVEVMRPMFRSGNNSDSCLIMPDGTIVEPLINPDTGSPFHRGSKVWQVPVYTDPPVTFYQRFGNIFAVFCFVAGSLLASWCIYRYLGRRQRLYTLIVPDTP